MILRLPLTKVAEAATAAFLGALRVAGFEGDLSALDTDRTVLATDNSIYRLVPQAIAFPRGTASRRSIWRTTSPSCAACSMRAGWTTACSAMSMPGCCMCA